MPWYKVPVTAYVEAGSWQEAQEAALSLVALACEPDGPLASAGLPDELSAGQLAGRWEYYQGRCWMCRGPAVLFDHVKPLVRGGSNWPSNQRPACWQCNWRKAQLWPYPLRSV